MKKTLIIIGAVSLGLIAIAIAGATLPADNTAQTPAPATTLSADELYVYAYVGDNLPKLGALYDDLGQACESLDYDGIVTCAEKAIAMSDEWNGIPVVGGNVAALESAYDDAGNGVARLVRAPGRRCGLHHHPVALAHADGAAPGHGVAPRHQGIADLVQHLRVRGRDAGGKAVPVYGVCGNRVHLWI